MSDVIININGGNNQILPNATEAVQNFYGDSCGRQIPATPVAETEEGDGTERLTLYINKENLPDCLSRISGCRNATELATLVVQLIEQEPLLTDEVVVKERFISLLLPHAINITKGKSIDNIRARINDALIKRPRRR